MCGIVGFIGTEQAAPILLEGLSRLEYRGHDSAGWADYDQEEGVYSWGPGKVPPEIAIGFRALKADGTYRMVKYYSCSVTSITAEYATKGQNTEGTPYVIALVAKTRIQDGKLYAMSDGTAAGDSTWLDTIDNLPAAGA